MSQTFLTGIPALPKRPEPNVWTEKLGTLDTEQYPWQTALLTELIGPFAPDETVKVVGFDGTMLEDLAVIRRLFPWEEVDSETARVITSYSDSCVDFIDNLMLSKNRYALESFSYEIKTHKGEKYCARMLSVDNYMNCLKYFF